MIIYIDKDDLIGFCASLAFTKIINVDFLDMDYKKDLPPLDLQEAWVWNGTEVVLDPSKCLIHIQARYEQAIQEHIVSTAQGKGYDDDKSLLSYVDDPNPVWDMEAKAFKKWRSLVWQKCHEILSAVDSEHIPTIEDIINLLPVIEWEV